MRRTSEFRCTDRTSCLLPPLPRCTIAAVEDDSSLLTEQAVTSIATSERLCAVVSLAAKSFTFALPPSGSLVLGRADGAGLHLPSNRVSRAHARLDMTHDGEAAVLTDLGSRNGTLVNGIAVAEPRVIRHGDEVAVGDARILFLRGSAIPYDTIALFPRSAFVDQLAEDVARASASGAPLYLFALALPEPWHQAAGVRRALEALPRMGYFGVLADNVLAVAAPKTREDEALAIEEMLVGAMRGAGAPPACGMVAARRGASATDLVDEAIDSIARSSTTNEGRSEGDPVLRSPLMVDLFEQAGNLARSPLHLLVVGETGAGKEVLARFIHKASGRRGPLVSINCAALPDALLESELFGHERGAFSGATQAKVGLIEAAHNGTLFLDEIGELPLAMQAKLLRVLEDTCVRRVGATVDRKVDVRFVSATNRNLEEAVRERTFRQDLLFRLNAGILSIPPLRDRRGEIGPLAQFFLERGAAARGLPVPKIAPVTISLLERYDWPGNVRELRNVMDRALALANGATVAPKHLPESIERAVAPPPSSARSLPPFTMPPPARSVPPPLPRPSTPFAVTPAEGVGTIRDEVADYERERIENALREAGGNQTKAAALLGIPRRTLAYRMNRLGIRSRT